MEKKRIHNDILIDNFDEVSDYPLQSIVPSAANSAEKLEGLIIRGYEMKYDNRANENNERYTPDALKSFIKRYFVDKSLNIPVTLMHEQGFDALVGRVLCVELNSVGAYFVVYIPRSHRRYNDILVALREKLLQGFSKEGFATDYELDENNVFIIKEFELLAMSLVATPANGLTFEKLQKIENATSLIDKTKQEKKVNDGDNSDFDDMLN